jgi:hypothetical protein
MMPPYRIRKCGPRCRGEHPNGRWLLMRWVNGGPGCELLGDYRTQSEAIRWMDFDAKERR